MTFRPTNIRSNLGFIVTGRVKCYLVVIQASQCPSLLYGRNPGFTVSCTIIWSKSRLHGLVLLFGRNPGFTIPYFLSGQNPGFRRNQVVIRSHPSFHLNLRPTNIWSTSGLHSNWPGKLLFGRIPSFVVSYIVIWSCPRLQYPLSLSGRDPGFTVSYTIIWSDPGFIMSRW